MGGGSGSHLGQVTVELLDASERGITSQQLINRWRAASGSFPGAERVVFQAADIGPGGNPIEFKVLLPRQDQHLMRQAVEMCKEQLQRFAGVFDIRDDSSPGKVELQFRIKDQAQAIGITAAELAETIRHAYYGAEVMRLQRGRHEVKLVVRYPREQRRSMTDFSDIRVRGADGVERPILELADITVSQGYSEINRLDQMRSVTVTADVDEAVANAREVIAKLKREFEPQLAEVFPAARIRWEGQQQQTQESLSSLWVGFSIALLVMYVLLVLQFRSYFQPVLILVIIPFGVIGAIFGHALMGLPMTLFSMFGLVALTGVVVNDSIVLVDFINQRVRGGMEFRQALLEAGQRRLRPIFLTSITTVAGLFPMLIERSMQAQVLIPMAVSLAFGLMMATLLVLFQIPVMYLLYLNIAIPFGVDPTEALLEDRQGEASRPAQTPSPVPQGA
jgi:multidrug efflux pump subunit AcrB